MPALPAAAPIIVHMPAGPQRRTIWIKRPQGVVLLSRLIVPSGTVASVTAEIPRVAGIAVTTANDTLDRCRPAARVFVCTRGQEWCPMPAARWRVTLTKQEGPAGAIRFVFVVGSP